VSDLHCRSWSPEYRGAVVALVGLGDSAERAYASAAERLPGPRCGCGVHGRVPGTLPGWGGRNAGPRRVLRVARGRDLYDGEHAARRLSVARWVDHPYRVRGDDGRWTYVAEPYGVCCSDNFLADVACLEDHGWRVGITAGRHFPGRTVAIRVEPPELTGDSRDWGRAA
jgi:hypothetical protein